MFSILTSVFNFTFGLLWDKVRDVTADKLQEGDLTDQKCREFIVRELDDITTKLDGLARKDLLSSISFLKEGLCLVNSAIQKVTDNEEAKEEDDEKEEEAWCILNHSGNFVVYETWPLVLPEAAKKLKITSQESFASAKASFKAAREKTTEAFNNEALCIEDRILATKLRMISRILESLEDPDPAAETCKLCIKELHDVPAVKEMFTVYLNGGIKSHFNKRKRLEMVMSVNMINFVLYDFICKFTKLPLNLFYWPRIKIGDSTYHPILENSDIMGNVKQSGGPRPIKQSIGYVYSCSVNSKREIVAWDNTSRDIKVLNTTTSEWRLFCTLSDEMIGPNVIKVWKIYSAIAVDGDDNVYIVVTFQTSDDVYHYTLFVFGIIGNLKYISTLEFLNENKRFFNTRLVLSKDRSIIHRDGEKNVWVCDHRGQLKYKFPVKTESHMYLMQPTISVSDKNEIIAAERRGRSVYIYTEGEMKRTIKVSESHEIFGVVFNHITKTIIVGTWLKNSYFLTSYSKTGEQQDTLEIPFRNPSVLVKIISHPSGHVVFVQGKHIIFI